MTDAESERKAVRAECLVEIWPPRPTGGQVVGPGPQGVKVTHNPTGITAFCEFHRSQHLNLQIAMDMIKAGLTHPRIPRDMLFRAHLNPETHNG